MNISIIASSYPRFDGDGTAPFVRSISLALQNLGNNIEVVAPYDPAVKVMDQKGISVKRFKYAPRKNWHIMGHSRSLEGDNNLKLGTFLLIIPYIFSGTVALYRSIRRQKSAVVHAHWSLPNGLCALIVNKLAGTPYIISLHGSDVYVSKKNVIFTKINEVVLKGAKAITACSNELFDYADNHGGKGRTHLIAWGADPTIFFPISEKAPIRREMNLPGDALIITSLGRLVPKKGFDVLVSAFAQAHMPSNTYLVIGGSGPQKESLVELSQKLGIEDRLILLGEINWNKTSAFLGASDVFVLPSIRDPHGNIDGLPTVLLEAMACGLPCIASNIGGVNLVLDQECNGLLCDPSSVLEFSESLMRLISVSELRDKFGKAARASVVDHFNWDQVGRQILLLC
ncbi:MAG: glycosyltransferase [Anaerolineaceae bacterium]